MKIAELRQLTPNKLKEALENAQRELAVIRFHVQTGQDQNTSKISSHKRMIAQILTLLNAKKDSK